MISIHQNQVALYLHDYVSLTSLMIRYPDKQPFELFLEHLIESNRIEQDTEEYYKRMLNIAYIFINMKLFSIAEDYTLKQKNNFINNTDLDLSFLDSKITGNRGSISNKKLLQMLRDGFNHTTEGNELYKISPSCRYIEFSFQRPSPITIKLSLDDISKLTDSISDAAQTFQLFSYNQPTGITLKEYIRNLGITRFYFPKKVDRASMDTVFELQKEKKYDEVNNLVNTFNQAFEKDILLSQTQINSIIKNIEELVNSGTISLDEFKENIKDVIMTLLNKELPIPILKLKNYLLDSYLVSLILPKKIFSYSQMYHILGKGLKIDEVISDNKTKDIFDTYRNYVFKTYYTNEQEKVTYASLLFIEYVLSNFKPDNDFIRIGKRTVEYRKLRNSLVHGRWHIEKEKVVFYDALPNIENETEYNWSVKLDLSTLYKYCFNILQNKLQLEKPKKLKKTVLHV